MWSGSPAGPFQLLHFFCNSWLPWWRRSCLNRFWILRGVLGITWIGFPFRFRRLHVSNGYFGWGDPININHYLTFIIREILVFVFFFIWFYIVLYMPYWRRGISHNLGIVASSFGSSWGASSFSSLCELIACCVFWALECQTILFQGSGGLCKI